ncbi:hypothetical protein [Streptomyces flavofungini]|uniref:Integral membrane protein n=1 Tax=Streptomyces flavofungini TaxID=68200 RepID=A0ABS0X7C8_9ACTN|nr:hypothetical protein [Streptomyces flavofungini]MBJ3809111.1 hypothetical protein [Streptomyces flavofungini]GHC68612.1 hypothetical protein GCM10010349_42860 [Streptomyces flavofungini]
MAYVFILCCFVLMTVVSLLAARVGHRGEVGERGVGYDVPDEVKRDPELRSRANHLVAHWCTGAAILSVAPLVPLGSVLLSDGDRAIGTIGMLIVAAYGLVVVAVAGYPFEKIKHLAR